MTGSRRLQAAARSALRGLCATPLTFVTSAGTLTAGLLLLAVYLLVLGNMRSVLERAGGDFKVVAYLSGEGIEENGDLSGIVAGARALEGVESVRYVSSQEALQQLRVALGPDASLLEGLERNPLPASLEIQPTRTARSSTMVRMLADRVERLPHVEEVRYGVEWVEGYTRVLRGVQWVGILLGGFLLLVLGAIVAGTVRLALHAREDEIRIQRLVGANTLFVQLPFYLEGIAQGVLAATGAVAVLYGLFALGLPLVGEPLRFLLGREDPSFLGPQEIALLIVIGVGLGVGGAAVSLAHMDEGA